MAPALCLPRSVPGGDDSLARDSLLTRMKSSSVNRTNDIAKTCRQGDRPMTRRRLLGQFGKAIEAAFTPYNLVPGPDDPPVLKVMSFGEFSHLQTEEIVRIGSKIVERIEQLFRHYRVARTGDDLCDFKSLALKMAIELFPDFRFKADPDLLELLFPLYGLLANGTCVFDYQLLVTRMADSCFSIKKQPNPSKPGNQLVLLWLLADVDAVQLARKRPRPYSDREAIKKLMGEEPFKARWGGMNMKTLCNWLSAARASLEYSEQRPVSKIS
jgi:hypothetical protein